MEAICAVWYSGFLSLEVYLCQPGGRRTMREKLAGRVVDIDFAAGVAALEVVPSAELIVSLFRLNVDQYERLVGSGVLDGQPIELINGFLVRKMGKKPPHVIASEAARDELLPRVPQGWRLIIEAPVRIPDFDEPEPDLGIVRGTREEYADHHPEPRDVGLLIDVADTTLERDWGERGRAYVAEVCRFTGSSIW